MQASEAHSTNPSGAQDTMLQAIIAASTPAWTAALPAARIDPLPGTRLGDALAAAVLETVPQISLIGDGRIADFLDEAWADLDEDTLEYHAYYVGACALRRRALSGDAVSARDALARVDLLHFELEGGPDMDEVERLAAFGRIKRDFAAVIDGTLA